MSMSSSKSSAIWSSVVTDDERWMARCLELAERGEGRTAPNPMVGCVIVDRAGALISEGYHHRLGAPHAEAEALAAARPEACVGATMYVNLEPCRHRGDRRTSPCAPRVLDSGIARLVVGMADPIPSHGGGTAWLKRRGVEVTRDVLGEQCLELNRGFVMWARRGRPWFMLKAGVTLDGRVATRAGESQWITGPEARKDGHRLRNRFDAILVGSATVLADDPSLTARGLRRRRDPIRLVLDSRLRTPLGARLLPANSDSKARVIIAATRGAPAAREQRLLGAGAEVWRLGRGGRVDLAALAGRLGDEGVTSVLVEGGATVHATMVAVGLADEIRLYMAPLVFGSGAGKRIAPPWVTGAGVAKIADAARFEFVGKPLRLGDDWVFTARARSSQKR